ncbi:MAG: hypothetical protein RIR70_2009 [Pseudomonadota bacterium]
MKHYTRVSPKCESHGKGLGKTQALQKAVNAPIFPAMRKRKVLLAAVFAGLFVLHQSTAISAEPEIQPSAPAFDASTYARAQASLFERAAASATSLADSALAFLGVGYRFGGNSPENGFDCSGLVRRVFQDALGLHLPRTAKEMSGLGQQVRIEDLKPGDLVFFNTMRAAFSHVGIYLGDNKFVHAPSEGGVVRVEDMRIRYWAQRFNGARRMTDEVSN